MTDMKNWRNTAAGNNIASPPDFPQENWSSAQVNDTMREMMAALARYYRDADYLDLNSDGNGTFGTVSRLSADSIRVAGVDVTSFYDVGRQVRVSISGASTVYRYVLTATLNGSDTDLVFTTDSANPVPSGANRAEAYIGSRVRSTAFKPEGAGNGLDADKVDGLEASDLSRSLDNAIINGAMQLWQRGTSFTGVGYTADRWRIDDLGTGGAATISRLALVPVAGVPEEIEYALRWAQTSTPTTNPVLEQRVEAARTFAGRQVTLSFYAKANTAISVSTLLRQSFGTGGTPSGDVSSTTAAHSITTAWQRFTQTVTLASVVSKSFGVDGNDYLTARFQLPTSTATLDITGVKLEARASASDFLSPSVSAELLRSQRYYWKTFPLDTAPTQNAGRTGTAAGVSSSPSSGLGVIAVTIQHPVSMFSTPSIVFYNPSFADTQWHRAMSVDGNNAQDVSSQFLHATQEMAIVGHQIETSTGSADKGRTYIVHLTAEAEL